MPSSLYRFIVHQKDSQDPRTLRLLKEAHALGFKNIEKFDYYDIYFIEGQLSLGDQHRLGSELLTDSFTQEGYWDDAHDSHPSHDHSGNIIEAAFRPGVTDVVAEQIVRGSHLLEIKNLQRAATGQGFIIDSKKSLTHTELQLLAERLLSNSVIQHYSIGKLTHVFSASPLVVETKSDSVPTVPLRHLDATQLLLLSEERRAALDTAEMLAIQDYFVSENRDPTEVEFEMIAQTWSEHCSHKTFKADINIDDKMIHGLLNTYIRKATEEINAPWVWSAFVDNAGIIDFDDEVQISFKVETHNHPSAIEPFGGANTGLGGVIRDILGVSAKPIAATDIFCFGLQDMPLEQLPEGTLHPRLISSGVIAGVQDYGNKTGIPTVNGAIFYDSTYTANPLVFCGCVGIAPKHKHPRNPLKGDRIIILGGRTGRDGLRGATFSSMTMDAMTGEVAGASVQIGDPITARGLIEVVTRARDAGLYNAITDCGAGGLSSAVGEMAADIGAKVELSKVELKYQGLLPWEIWLSEAQERMVMAVPLVNLPTLQAICDIFDLELTDIGEFTDSGVLEVYHQQQLVLKLSNQFLHHSMPKKKFDLSSYNNINKTEKPVNNNLQTANLINHTEMLLKLLSHPNIASKQNIIRRYDHEVQGSTIIKPLTGIQNDGPSDACVLKPMGTKGLRGIVLSNGINPELGKQDPYAMALSVIDEAIRNAVAVGADPSRIAILDNFCWGDPKRPETLSALVEAARGCYTAALHYQTPFISGKDSLNNEYLSTDGQRHAIPSTLLISAIGIIKDITTAITMDFKAAGNIIYLLGETKPQFAGSHYRLLNGNPLIGHENSPDLPLYAPLLYKTLHQIIQAKIIRSCHDLSEGGLAVALAEMCIAGRLGCKINLTSNDIITALFSESNGRFLVEVEPKHCTDFETCFPEDLLPLITKIGTVTADSTLLISHHNNTAINLSLNHLLDAFFTQH